jgi:MoaA/NifB/PqqE/SkfB family radical SAM enzyme
MCCLWGREGLLKISDKSLSYIKGDLDFYLLKNLIDNVYFFKPTLIFTGGEPLLHPNIKDILYLTYKKNFRIFVATGGYNLKENAKLLVKTVSHLQISLDGLEEEQDKSRGVKGSFKKVLEGIREVAKLKGKNKKPFLNICCTITDMNYKKLYEFTLFLSSLDIKFNELAFQHLEFTTINKVEEHNRIFSGKDGFKNNFWKGFLYHPENLNLKVLIKETKKLKNKSFKNIKRIVFRPNLKISELKDYYKLNKIPHRFKRKCLAPWYEVFVMPNGEVGTCPDFMMGDLKKENLLKIWNNNKFCDLRINLNKKNYFPICKSCASFYAY